MSRIPLGPFDLIEPLAKGGMGEVWAAEHREQQVEVAIKVITADYARHPGFQASLRQEVRSMASLSHPLIVRVLDQGEIDGQAARFSNYQLVEGSPYIAMEMIRGTTLTEFVLKLPWEDVRTILIKLLQALAHAHARDVLHRDLKPANILLAEGGTTWQIKLTDFGIAHPLHSDQRLGPKVAGTPHFMAPEQHAGEWRKYRPSTDLYSVGRIASALLLRSEANQAAVPPGFNAWMARILAKTPQHRFAFAADAAWSLRQLGDPTDTLDLAFLPGKPATTAHHTNSKNTFSFAETTDSGLVVRQLSSSTFDTTERPDLPSTWRTTVPKPPTRQIKNAGAGLFALRTIELVGRTAARDKLWQKLQDVTHSHSLRVVILRGVEGIGKASLAHWFGERAYEVGAAWTFHAAFSPVPGEADPLARMVANELNSGGMNHEEARPHIQELAALFHNTDPHDIDALVELANPASPGAGGFQFASSKHRTASLARFIRWTSLRRPVILHLEHVQWSTRALQLVEACVAKNASQPFPVLVVLSVDDNAISTCPLERAQLEALQQSLGDRCVELPLGPLPPAHQRAMISSLLGLDPTLVARTADQTRGNPLHAVQLVSRWHHEGKLVEGPNGLVLAPGESSQSHSVEDLWKHRLEQFLEDERKTAPVALELLAVLGTDVPQSDWLRLSRRAGIQPSRGLVDRLIHGGMLKVSPQKIYTLSHPSLRQAILDMAEQAGRLKTHHQNCADLVKRYDKGPGREGRIGEHLLYGGRAQAALHYLFQGAKRAVEEGAVSRARELQSLLHRAVRQLQLPPSDPRHGDELFLDAAIALSTSETRTAERAAELLRRKAVAQRWPQHLALATNLLGKLAYFKGESTEALALLPLAIKHSKTAKDRTLEASGNYYLARVHYRLNEFALGGKFLARARKLYALDNDTNGETLCLLLSALAAMDTDHPDEALTLANAARSLAVERGSLPLQAAAIEIAGEVHSREGRLEMAQKAYTIALKMQRVTSNLNSGVTAEMNLAVLCHRRGEDNEALELLGGCIERLRRSQRRPTLAIAHALMLPSLAATRNQIAFERHLSAAQELFRSTGRREATASKTLAEAAVLAAAQGWTELSEAADQLARATAQP